MEAAIVCEQFGWTWEEYINQPVTFLQVIKEQRRAAVDVANRRARMAERGR